MKEISTAQLLDISIALSAEKDRDTLLEHILNAAMDITDCDAGTLYIKSGQTLAFRLMITRSMQKITGGHYEKIDLPPVPISRQNACACAVLDGRLFNLPDVYASDSFDFSGPRRYDAITGYKTTSMLVVPMEDDKGQIIGVLQLINALGDKRTPIPFPAACEQVILALASQAAICMTNMNYAVAVQELLNSLVSVLSTAIDARSPYNANHTRNMASYADRFIDWLNKQEHGWYFTDSEKRQFLMSVWLHDVGKLTTPLYIMDKESRLSSALERVLTRLETISLLGRIHNLKTGSDNSSLEQALLLARQVIETANTADFLTDELLAHVNALALKTYVDAKGAEKPWLTSEELTALSVRKGTLTEAERKIMENHVLMTERILSEVKFTGEYEQVPLWAMQHHEYLNGHGYPFCLRGDEIPKETRLLTILDIFDALTAIDRPYKDPIPMERALKILHAMVDNGQLDGQILALFVESRAWEETM